MQEPGFSLGVLIYYRNSVRSQQMDREHVKGAADKAKGAVKDTVGKMTGDTKMRRRKDG